MQIFYNNLFSSIYTFEQRYSYLFFHVYCVSSPFALFPFHSHRRATVLVARQCVGDFILFFSELFNILMSQFKVFYCPYLVFGINTAKVKRSLYPICSKVSVHTTERVLIHSIVISGSVLILIIKPSALQTVGPNSFPSHYLLLNRDPHKHFHVIL